MTKLVRTKRLEVDRYGLTHLTADLVPRADDGPVTQLAVVADWRRTWLGWWYEPHAHEYTLQVGLGPITFTMQRYW